MPATHHASTWVLGSWSTASVVRLHYLPEIISEWTAIIPLACHLASYKRDHTLVGRLALTGRLSIDIFPKLGVLYGLSKLFRRGTEFIDHASTKGSQSYMIWDVRWGSVFPCANGGASSMIIQHVMGDTVTAMPDALPQPVVEATVPVQTLSAASTLSPMRENSATSSSTATTRNLDTAAPCLPHEPATSSQKAAAHDNASKPSRCQTKVAAKAHRRVQTLHVLHFTRQCTRKSWLQHVDAFGRSWAWQLVLNICILCTTIAMFAFGLYGTAVIMVCGTIAQLGCRLVTIERPPGYLQSNEADEQAFMLFGLHQNTSSWYLFTGDRGIVDGVLNKTMIAVVPSRYSKAVAWLLRCTHTAQLVAMTFVAGQKGWDGMALVVLMVINALGRWPMNVLLVRKWMESEGVDIKVKSFNFTGRTMMLGAIQDFSHSRCESWMDNIISPHPRRDAWLARLSILAGQNSNAVGDIANNTDGRWSPHDWNCILLSSELAHLSADVLRNEFPAKASV